jgi:hypothetical protein
VGAVAMAVMEDGVDAVAFRFLLHITVVAAVTAAQAVKEVLEDKVR